MILNRHLSAAFFIPLAFSAALAHAQAPINSNVALQPSKGGLIIRQQFRYTHANLATPSGKMSIDQTSSFTTFVYGATEKFTLILDTPFVLSRQTENKSTGVSDTDAGLADIKLLTKFRIYRDDFAPTNTTRIDFIGGLELPTGQNAFSSDSVDPILGGVITHVEDRNAFNADALWIINTGSRGADLFRYDLAYAYRISPETYASKNPTAFFGLIELNGFYETNNDHEIFLSPGLQYVTQLWIFEATVQLPIYQDLASRPERDLILGLGFRVQF